MAVYSCRNCSNLKIRIITKKSLKSFKRDKIKKALDIRDTESLGLDFPFNLTAYKRVTKYDECKIIYCSEHMFSRDLYIFQEHLDLDSLVQRKNKPCPKYK